MATLGQDLKQAAITAIQVKQKKVGFGLLETQIDNLTRQVERISASIVKAMRIQ